jgi:hypothetical protein
VNRSGFLTHGVEGGWAVNGMAQFHSTVRRAGAILSMLLLCAASARAGSLPPGTYNFQDSAGNTWDGGFNRWNPSHPGVYEYSYNNGPDQQFIWNGRTLQESCTLAYVFNNSDTLALGANAGTFAIVSSGNGYTIQDMASGLYVNSPFAQSPPNAMYFSPTPTIWTARPVANRINDTDASIIYSAGNRYTLDWHYSSASPEDYRHDEHSSNFVRSGGDITGVKAVVNFNGTGITWVGKKGPNYGIASYSIDGGPPRTVDNYHASEIDQHADVVISGLAPGSHALSISLTDQPNNSSDHWQTIDAFDINGSALTRSQGTSAGFSNQAQLVIAGTWGSGAPGDGSDLSGGHFWSKETNASISWTFNGSLIEVFGRPDYEDGYMDVYIDNSPQPVASVNGHWGFSDDDTLNSYMLFAKKLSPGQHIIKVVVAGRHDSTARGNYVQIDEFIAFK